MLLIGDSLSVGTKPYFTRELVGSDVQVDATSGIKLDEGMRRYRATKDKPRVVEMALFTNNSPGQVGELKAALAETIKDARARGGKVVWATIARPGNYDAANALIREAAAANPDVMELVDWQRMVTANPGWMAADGVHANATGYRARARAFADAAR
ncbi:MAG: hypothetical protein JWM86_2435 [Thermoleophilia bacterium]|nr:hypothetical protein [Thermoleophilia bacterium]